MLLMMWMVNVSESLVFNRLLTRFVNIVNVVLSGWVFGKHWVGLHLQESVTRMSVVHVTFGIVS